MVNLLRFLAYPTHQKEAEEVVDVLITFHFPKVTNFWEVLSYKAQKKLCFCFYFYQSLPIFVLHLQKLAYASLSTYNQN
ncbi:MAG: hypothetical protein EAZ95_11815 [Bacteroidetes bacterium]|nr:MAG: hypothetical protein EAZ95_11815 [Bacteroidota bacterium]